MKNIDGMRQLVRQLEMNDLNGRYRELVEFVKGEMDKEEKKKEKKKKSKVKIDVVEVEEEE